MKKLENILQSKASTFLISGYLSNIDYEIINLEKDLITYQEIYKEGLVFSSDNNSSIKIKIANEGVYQATYPKIIRNNLISSAKGKNFLVENISEVLNYLYLNIDLATIEDLELGYEKTQLNDTLIYTPTWYVKYKGKYIKYIELKEKVKKGTI